MTDEMVLSLPDENAPGYLRRYRIVLGLINRPFDPEAIDAIVDFLLPFVKEPEDRDKARDAILDMPREDYQAVLRSFLGLGKVPPNSGGASGTG
jgi:hypothetical protein